MKNYRKFIRRSLIFIVAAYAAAVLFLIIAGQFIQFRNTDTELVNFFVTKGLPIHIKYYTANGRQLRYMYSGDDPSKPTFLFIHGAPASSSYYKSFFADTALRHRANLVAVDRAGYGYSGYGQADPDIAHQAAMIKPVLDSMHYAGRPVTIVAASYGTSIASRLVMDYPELVDGLLLIAPSLAPGEEKTYSVSYALESPFFSWATPGMIHSADVEKLNHRQQLENIQNRWGELKLPVIYMQGVDDHLIYTTNAAFAKSHITHAASLSIRMIPGRGHLLVHKEEALVKQTMMEMATLSGNYYVARRLNTGKNLQTASLISSAVRTSATQ